MNNLKQFAVAAALAGMLAGCGGGGGGGDENYGAPEEETTVRTGVFLDAPVEGLRFVTASGLTGVTGEGGEFLYRRYDDVSFYIGEKLYIGTAKANAQGVITPESLLDGPNEVWLMRILQSIDENGNPDDGIRIPADLIAGLDNGLRDEVGLFSTGDPLEVSGYLLLYADKDGDGELDVGEAEAIRHYRQSLDRIAQYTSAKNRDNIERAKEYYTEKESRFRQEVGPFAPFAEKLMAHVSISQLWFSAAKNQVFQDNEAAQQAYWDIFLHYELPAARIAADTAHAILGSGTLYFGQYSEEVVRDVNTSGYGDLLDSLGYDQEARSFYMGCHVLGKRLDYVREFAQGTFASNNQMALLLAEQFASLTEKELGILESYGNTINLTCDNAPSL